MKEQVQMREGGREGGSEGGREGGRRMCSLVLKHLPNYWAN